MTEITRTLELSKEGAKMLEGIRLSRKLLPTITVDQPLTVVTFYPDTGPLPNVMIVKDGKERPGVVVDAERFERLQAAAKGWVSECDRTGDGPDDGMRRAGLEPGDLDPLPEHQPAPSRNVTA